MASGWNRASPLPVIGTTPGDIRTRPARMLKNPSRGPNRSDGARIVQSRPLSRTRAIAFAFELA
jgi:hypothetical protein